MSVSYEHKLPLSEGGTHDRRYLITLCKSCHPTIHAKRGDYWGRTMSSGHLSSTDRSGAEGAGEISTGMTPWELRGGSRLQNREMKDGV